MKTAVELPDESFAEAKAIAVRRPVSLNTLFTRALERKLEGPPRETRQGRFRIDESDWPVLRVAEDEAMVISNAFVNELREAEGGRVMKLARILVTFICLAFLISTTQGGEIDEIVRSDISRGSKRDAILECLREVLKPGERVPRIASKAALKENFEFSYVAAGRPPFEMDVQDKLYAIEIFPKSDERTLVYFSSEQRFEGEILLEVFASDLESTRIMTVKKVLFFP